MAESTIKAAAQLLGKLLVEQINHLDDVRGLVEGLKDELNSLAAYAVDAAKSRCQDEVVRVALFDARNIAYDSEDVIEKYIHKVASHGHEDSEGCQIGSVMRWACLGVNAVPILEIHTQITELNKRIAALQNRMISYGVSYRMSEPENNPASHLNEPLRRVYSHNREESVVVGFENQVDELVEKLLNPTDKTVIALCGMGGIGKSTMAREVYHHPKLRGGDSFKAFGWAVVSQRFQPDKVLKELMYSLVSENDHDRRKRIDNAIKSNRAHRALYELMRESKCLVVIDDIWTSRDWAELEAAFPRNDAIGSRLFLTTRNQETVSCLDPDQVYLYPVKALDDTKSWELFQMIVFPGAKCTDSKKDELGQAMLRHCQGVPLAIVVLSKILKRKESADEWQQMCDNISAQLGRGIPNLYKEVYDVLKVSYDELPIHLKHCFLYLAHLTQGYTVPAGRLCKKWIAEGVVLKEDGKELEEDIAEIYLNELVSRNMVQARALYEGTNRIKDCGLHDLMRDVCIEIANKEGFFQTFHCDGSMLLTSEKKRNDLLMNLLTERDKGLRRLVVHIGDEGPKNSIIPASITSANPAPNLRSLTLSSNYGRGKEGCKRLVETILEDCPLLRVFDCGIYSIQGIFPKNVSNLIHLRYLSLNGARISELPSSITKLQLLQTLDLQVHSDVVISIPNVLWKIKTLRHVLFPYYGDLRVGEEESGTSPRYLIKGGEFLRLDGLVNLQSLMYINLDRVDPHGVSNLESLKKLNAVCKTNLDALQRLLLLGQRTGMQMWNLRVYGGIIYEDPMILSTCEALVGVIIFASQNAKFKLRQPLRLEMLPKRIAQLSLWYVELDDDPLPVLQNLPNLRTLSLIKCYGGQKMVCTNFGFPELRALYLNGLTNLSDLEVEEGALPKLTTLSIYDCPLRNTPDALPISVTFHND